MARQIPMYCSTCQQHFQIHDPYAVHGHMKSTCSVSPRS